MTTIARKSSPLGVIAWSLGLSWQFLRRWPVIPGIVIVILLFSAIFAPWIKPYDQLESHGIFSQGPAWTAEGSRQFLLGTDHIGRDILSRMIEASRITVVVVLLSVTVGMISGTFLGLIAGYFGGTLIDEVIMRIVDVWAALPQLLVLLAIALVFGSGIFVLVTSLALISWPGAVRLVRVEALRLRSMDYVDSARISGATNRRILVKHIFPGVINTVLVRNDAFDRQPDPDRGYAELPRSWDPAAQPVSRWDDLRRPRLPARCPSYRVVPGIGTRRHRHGRKLPR